MGLCEKWGGFNSLIRPNQIPDWSNLAGLIRPNIFIFVSVSPHFHTNHPDETAHLVSSQLSACRTILTVNVHAPSAQSGNDLRTEIKRYEEIASARLNRMVQPRFA